MNENQSHRSHGAGEPAGTGINRRHLLASAAALAALPQTPAPAAPLADAFQLPLIDTHIHLFDPTRPQGVPYRGPENAETYESGAFPEGYARIAEHHGVAGAIAVEASPWVEDNLWLLETAGRSALMVGVIGNLDPQAPDFGTLLERFARNPLFRGVRSGNLWGRNLLASLENPAVLDALRQIAQAGLVFETANPNLGLIEAIARIGDAVPTLTIIIDHFPRYFPAKVEASHYHTYVRALAARPRVFVKLSGGPEPVTNAGPEVPGYKERLDRIIASWGPDRLIFGSDWPNIEKTTPVSQAITSLRSYFADRAKREQESFYWRNSIDAYGWRPRNAEQQALFAQIAAPG